MIVSTLPVGGHYPVDVLAAAAISIAAIHGIRCGFGRSSRPQHSITALGVNEIS
jgi:membrane-associated phospholipid phosphatase